MGFRRVLFRSADVAFLERSMAVRCDGDPAAGGGRGLQRRGSLDILVEIGYILEGHLGERHGRIAEAPQLVGWEVRMRDEHYVRRQRPLTQRHIALAICSATIPPPPPRPPAHHPGD